MILYPTTFYSILKPILDIFIALVLMILAYIFNDIEYYYIFPSLAMIFVLKYLYRFFYLRTTMFKISKEQIEFKRGVFSIKTDFLELYRIKDHSLKEPFLLRVIGVKQLILESSDKSHPVLKMTGIKVNQDFILDLRRTIENQRKLKRVYEVD